jgi:putative spermidine/putrescine transport system ATP-binding protein|tara:strand:+ start:240 stop:1379 length:1140 start_codon:yes stop_codon:yes gene_type:complete
VRDTLKFLQEDNGVNWSSGDILKVSPIAAQIAADETAGITAISITGLNKSFDKVQAVVDLNLEISQGEFFSMLGPSGSGKTTVLRILAGFETASSGKVLLEGTDVTDLAPFDRDVNTVFQDYALFPHMSIQKNVEYGLKARKISKPKRAKLASQAIDSVKLSHLADRLPHQLSGGQRQRIALARALVLRPKVLLLDEPLGALDKQLREEMQVELKRIQREAGITFIFVTHDQEEAMRMSDRIAVFNAGRIEQIGTPAEVYENPATEFVAGFLGVSNLLSGEDAMQLLGSADLVNIRPERIKILPENSKPLADEISVRATIVDIAYTGANTLYTLEGPNGLRLVTTRLNQEMSGASQGLDRSDKVLATFQKEHVAKIPNK